MCANNQLAVGGSLFPHKRIHKATWISPNYIAGTANQIDHICINKQFRTSLLDVKVHRGADVGSDATSGHDALPSLQTAPCPDAPNFSSWAPSVRPAGAGSLQHLQECTSGSTTSMPTLSTSSLRSGSASPSSGSSAASLQNFRMTSLRQRDLRHMHHRLHTSLRLRSA